MVVNRKIGIYKRQFGIHVRSKYTINLIEKKYILAVLN